MSLDQRSNYLLHLLINHETPLSLKELTGSLKVSRRTIYYDVKKINHWLSTHKLDEIQVEPTKGFHLTKQTKKQIQGKLKITNNYSYKYSESERQTMIFLIILLNPNPIHLKDLTDWTSISRNTCLSDLKKVSQTCQSYRLKFLSSRKNGYTISGSEYQIRKLFLDLFTLEASSFASHATQEICLFYDRRFFTIVELVEKLLIEVKSHLKVELRTETIHQLSWQLAFFCHRVRLNQLIQLTEEELRTLQDIPLYSLISDLLSSISKESSIQFPDVEVCYFTIFLLSNRFQMVDQLHHVSDMKKVVRKMVFEFQKVACLNFEHQEELEKNLLTHVQSAYYRLKYQIQTENHLLDSIKENYSEVFQLTKKIIYLLEDFVGVRVDDHELAYIAMHLGGWMRKEGVTLTKKRKALIVCNHGIGTSQILKSQLETLFSSLHFEVISSINLISDSKDIYCIFTTVRIEEAQVPIYYVNPILTDKEKERLLQSVHSLEEPTSINLDQVSSLLKTIEAHTTIHNKAQLRREIEMILLEKIGVKENYKPMLNELINESTILFENEVSNWQKAIELAASPLIQNKSITVEYPKAMIESIKSLGPYVVLAPGVAIPHARPEHGVSQLSMSLLKLDSPIAFAEGEFYQVSLIFVLAAIDNESHLKALMQLSNLLSDEQNISKLMNSTTKEDILELIHHYSTEGE